MQTLGTLRLVAIFVGSTSGSAITLIVAEWQHSVAVETKTFEKSEGGHIRILQAAFSLGSTCDLMAESACTDLVRQTILGNEPQWTHLTQKIRSLRGHHTMWTDLDGPDPTGSS